MIELGVNSVLFVGHDLATAMKHVALAGYDGIELSAIKDLCEHIDLDRWQEQADEIKSLAEKHRLKIFSMEVAQRWDEERLAQALEAAAGIGIPIVNIGSGGKSHDEADFQQQTDRIARLSEKAESLGVMLCLKPHTRASIVDTPTTLRALAKISSPAFAIDIDTSHIHRAGERPDEALNAIFPRVRHVHVRDCIGREVSPGEAQTQTLGRGEIDLPACLRALVTRGYSGPVCLEVILANKCDLTQQSMIASESYGYLNACLQLFGART